MKLKKLFFFLALVFSGFVSIAQTEMNPETEFIYKNRQYAPYRPWWTVGGGYGYNFSEKVFEPNFLLDVHFRVAEKYYFGVGYATSREHFFDVEGPAMFLPQQFNKQSMNSFHALYGWRGEDIKRNYAFFIGPAINWGYDYLYTDTLDNVWHQTYFEPGIYVSLQYSRKLYYDLGPGVTLWGCVNKKYQVIGLSFHFYFSTAYIRHI